MKKRYRVVLFSNAASSTKELNFSKFNIALLGLTCFLLLASVTTVGVSVLSKYLYSFRLGLIQEERNNIRQSLKELNEQYDDLNKRIGLLIQQDDNIRRELDLEPLGSSVHDVGLGGSFDTPSAQSEFFFSEQELLSEITTEKLAKLKFLIEQEEKSYASLYVNTLEHKERIRYYPSIPPINEEDGTITVTDLFGMRKDPLGSGGWEPHRGLDIRGKIGTPVLATADGTVIEVVRKPHNDLGIYLVISHNHTKYGYLTKYGHLSKIEPDITVGTKVTRWEKIGEVGRTGRVTGPHLHYEVHRWGKAIDPIVQNWNPEIFNPFFAESDLKELKKISDGSR